MDTPSPKKAVMENPIMTTWKRMKSFGHTSSATTSSIKKSKSWHGYYLIDDAKNHEAKPPHGFFTVYVGPMKQRIMVKTKLINHPLFNNLLEDAETEYGHRFDGPIVLPCEVDFFLKVLADMNSNSYHSDDHGDVFDDNDDHGSPSSPICGLASPYKSCTH